MEEQWVLSIRWQWASLSPFSILVPPLFSKNIAGPVHAQEVTPYIKGYGLYA